jgi:hypothetical protein
MLENVIDHIFVTIMLHIVTIIVTKNVIFSNTFLIILRIYKQADFP